MEMPTDEKVFITKLSRISNYQFKANFDSPKDFKVLIDEPEPIGEGSAPSASQFLAAAVGNCLSASLSFCFEKAKIDLGDFNTVVETVIRKKELVILLKAELVPTLKERFENPDGEHILGDELKERNKQIKYYKLNEVSGEDVN